MSAMHDGFTVLVIEDEQSYREALSVGLRLEGFRVVVAEDGGTGLSLLAEVQPDIVLLDMLLPDMHGIDVCRQIRAVSSVPVVVVSAVDSELDIVLGLELGAAGYVTKPFRLRELVARMHAILRRAAPVVPVVASPLVGPSGQDEVNGPDVIRVGATTVDLQRREVLSDGDPVRLSRKEFDLLATLLTPAGRMRSRTELLDLLWPDQYLLDSRTLDTHIHRLRSKVEPDPTEPRFIITIRGVGFRIDLDGGAQATQPSPMSA